MNCKKLMSVLLAVCLVCALCACGDSGNQQTEGTQPPAQTTEPTQQTTEPTVSGVVYTVKVVDEGGNPIAGAFIQMCQGENCTPMQTDASGVATYNMSEEAEYEVKFITMPAGYQLTTQESVFHFADGSRDMTITLKAAA